MIPFVACMLVRGPDFNNRFERRINALGLDTESGLASENNTNQARLLELQRLLGPVAVAKWIMIQANGQEPLLTNDLGYAPFANSATQEAGIAIPLDQSHVLAIIPRNQGRIATACSGRWIPDIDYVDNAPNNHESLNEALASTAQRFVFGPDRELIKKRLQSSRATSFSLEPRQFGFISGSWARAHEFTWHRLTVALESDPSDNVSEDFPLDLDRLSEGWAPAVLFPTNLVEFPPALYRKGQFICARFYDPNVYYDISQNVFNKMSEPQEADELWEEAEKAHHEHRYDAASVLWKRYLEAYPGNVYARSNRAFCLLNSSQPEEALAEARKANEQDSAHAGTAIALLEGLANNDLTDELAQKAELFSGEPMQLPAAWLHKGKLAFFSEDYGEAIRCLRQATNSNPGYCLAWLVMGESLMLSKRYREALDAFGRALGTFKYYPSPIEAKFDALTGMSRAQLFLGRPDVGLILAKQSEILNVNAAESQRMKARCMFAIGSAEASATAESAISLGSQDDYLKLTLASVYITAGRVEDAKKLSEGINPRPDDFGTRHEKASVHIQLGETDKAIEELHALSDVLEPYVLFNSLATAHRVNGNPRKALRSLSKAIKARRDVAVLTNAGAVLADLGRPRLAEKLLQEALSVEPKSLGAAYELGHLYAVEEKTSSARVQFRSILEHKTADESLKTHAADMIGRLDRGQELERLRKEQDLVSVPRQENESALSLLRHYQSNRFEDECCRVSKARKGSLRWSSAEPRRILRHAGTEKEVDAYGQRQAGDVQVVCLGECKLRITSSDPIDYSELNELVSKVSLARNIEAASDGRKVEGYFFTNAEYDEEAQQLAAEHGIRIFRTKLSRNWQSSTSWKATDLVEVEISVKRNST